jgi:hypothetical protein
MVVEQLARNMLFKTYKGSLDVDYPVSDMMCKLYTEVFRKPLSNVKRPWLDISYVPEVLSSWFSKEDSNDCTAILMNLC